MVSVNLRPIAKHQDAMLSYLDVNFRRIADTLAALANAEQGIELITGSIEIDTGMAEVHNVIASFHTAPNSGAAFIRAFPVGESAPRNIIIEVYDSSFSPSTTEVGVAWYAVGE
jgi:hypothetical protein